MQTSHTTISYQKDDIIHIPLPSIDTMLFDIETTGFSSTFSFVYLIGCAYYQNNNLYITQFFANNKTEEVEILKAFAEYSKKFTSILSFNGNGFDLPFIKNRFRHYHFEDNLESLTSIDLYKHALQLKRLLSLDNYKQKTIEKFLGLQREDTYNGKELINLYETYAKEPDEDIKNLIFLHNSDDIKGLFSLISIQSYIDFSEGKFSISDYHLHDYYDIDQTPKKELLVELQVPFSFPTPTHKKTDLFYIFFQKSVVKISIYLTEGVLKYFLPNYKDYYYLPEEDIAIHKDIAGYVDKKFRTAAKAATCYVKKEGLFAPQYTTLITPSYKVDYSDPISYFEISNNIDTDELYHYIIHLLKVFLY